METKTIVGIFNSRDCRSIKRKKYDVFDPVASYRKYWGILVLFNVVFFVAAFAGFMRYDVR